MATHVLPLIPIKNTPVFRERHYILVFQEGRILQSSRVAVSSENPNLNIDLPAKPFVLDYRPLKLGYAVKLSSQLMKPI